MDLPDSQRSKRILNIGCGAKKISDALNVDISASVNPDLVLNLNQRPWPLPDDQFDVVIANDVIEHLDDVIGTMEEIHRVSRKAAVVKVTVPHFSSSNAFTDPT